MSYLKGSMQAKLYNAPTISSAFINSLSMSRKVFHLLVKITPKVAGDMLFQLPLFCQTLSHGLGLAWQNG